MEIIKRGTPPADRQYEVKCKSCATEFRFKQAEASVEYYPREGAYVRIQCPVCRTTLVTSTDKYIHGTDS